MTPLPSGDAGPDAWRAFLAPYAHVVLIANSAETDLEQLAGFPPDTLFVFFNKVYKILDSTFNRPSILVSRSGVMGANIVHRREVAAVIGHFDAATFLGIVNIVIGNNERFSPAEDFGGRPVAHLDLDPLVAPIYPAGQVPTTGFGLCLWLNKLDLPARLTLAGFSSRRSERWKVFDIHDWTFEQVVLRLLHRKGEIDMIGNNALDPYAGLRAHFPQFTPEEIHSVTDEVLADRLGHLGSTVDRLMSVTKPLRFLDQGFRKLRPRTRKQKYMQKQAREQGEDQSS